MKVAYLLGSLGRGGTETLLLDVFRNATMAAYDFIGIHRKGGVYQSDFYKTRQSLFQCAPRRGQYISYLLRLRKLLKQNKITIVHAQQSLDCIYAKLATIGTHIKVVETFHGYDYGFSFFDRMLNLLSIKWADAVFFVSEAQKQYYIQAYHLKRLQKLSVVYNGVNFTKLDAAYPNSQLPVLEKIVSQSLKLAMVGNFVRGREQNTVCQFLKILKENGIAFDFYFIGKKDEKNPQLYDNCVQFCKANALTDCVYFLGSRSDIPAILRQLDAFIYSTDHDTFGIAVVEAMAAGIPVFVNDWVVMKEITHNGEWAILYKTKDAVDLYEKFLFFIQKKETYKKRACTISSQVMDAYSIQKHIERLGMLYKEIISNM